MKAMLDDMIAIWVARYCVVTASQSMLIGKGIAGITSDDILPSPSSQHCTSCAAGEKSFPPPPLPHFSAPVNPNSIGELQ